MNQTRSVFSLAVGIGLVVLPACSKHVPSDVAPLVDSVRTDADAVAVVAAKQCAEMTKSGRMTASPKGCAINKLPGEEIVPETPSPAKGTALDTNPNVANVFVTCNVPTTPNEACGIGLGPLRPTPGAVPVNRGPNDPAGSTCKSTPTDCNEVITPSHYLTTPGTADFRVVKPVSGGAAGATAEITIILKK
ncbi:MAG: hypothetical protein ABI461_16730 [Polyangiaceae bacterium]